MLTRESFKPQTVDLETNVLSTMPHARNILSHLIQCPRLNLFQDKFLFHPNLTENMKYQVGVIHELGHNVQRNTWNNDRYKEVTVIILVWYQLENQAKVGHAASLQIVQVHNMLMEAHEWGSIRQAHVENIQS